MPKIRFGTLVGIGMLLVIAYIIANTPLTGPTKPGQFDSIPTQIPQAQSQVASLNPNCYVGCSATNNQIQEMGNGSGFDGGAATGGVVDNSQTTNSLMLDCQNHGGLFDTAAGVAHCSVNGTDIFGPTPVPTPAS